LQQSLGCFLVLVLGDERRIFQNVFERARREEGEDVNLANLFSLSIRCLIVVCVCADAS
jgi:hypothetical protein